MKQYPSRLKFKKNHRPSLSTLYLKEAKLFYPEKGVMMLQSLENYKLTFNQLESCRKCIRRIIEKQGVVFLRVFTNISVTKKPVATRMGKGKGSHHIWMAVIKRGQIICELICPSIEKFNISFKALKAASTKLPVRTKINHNFY